jgi:hypothetical protein
MKDYEVIGWPEVQELMEYEGFRENTALIDINENMGIGSSTYLVNKEWLDSLSEK